jgi:hypothetical protein
MSHFYADIQGSRGEATRCGTKSSGMSGHIRGWNVGVRVIIDYDENLGEDVVAVYATGGSNGSRLTQLICTIREDGKIIFKDERLNLIKRANEILEA